jgi:prepilin-type N-terminal cleavage/methylation domain-containing protein
MSAGTAAGTARAARAVRVWCAARAALAGRAAGLPRGSGRRWHSASAARARRRAMRRARAAGRIRSAGLTLAELLVVLVILGIVAAAVTPAVRRPGIAAGRVAEEIAAVYGAARAAAAARGDVVRVSVELATGAFLVAADAEGAASPVILRAGRIALPAGVRLAGGSGGTARAAFEPRGRARADAVVVQQEDRAYAVDVDAWTGAIRVERLRVGEELADRASGVQGR